MFEDMVAEHEDMGIDRLVHQYVWVSEKIVEPDTYQEFS